MKRIAILQSNYIPWKGYFDIIDRCDAFVLLDTVQYTKGDWRNRNRIWTPSGVAWLTVPVVLKGKFGQNIEDVCTANNAWRRKHWMTLYHSYGNAPFFGQYEERLKELYLGSEEMNLSAINRAFLQALCDELEISTPILSASDLNLKEGKNERLLGICADTRATHYLSGPSAKGYLDEAVFADAGIAVEWMEYGGYPDYPQIHNSGPCEHGVSILDLLFNVGPEAANHIRKS